MIASLGQDLRYALRQLRKSPAFTVVAVITLALGIGANTAIFSLLDTILLRALPVAAPNEIVALSRTSPSGEGESFTYPEFEQFHSASRVFSGVFCFAYRSVRVSSARGEKDNPAQLVSSEYFRALGVTAILGRTVSVEDLRSSREQNVAVISYRYWQQEFAGEPSIIGKGLTVSGVPFTIVGVMPRSFYGTSLDYSVDLWLPITAQPRIDGGASNLESNGINWVIVMARLKSGVSPERATVVANTLLQRYLRSAKADPRLLEQRIRIEAGGRPVSGIRSDLLAPLVTMMAIVVLVLLLACANVANFMLARGVARSREIAVRLAIGAGRRRLIQQLLTESLLLALLGSVAGIGVASVGDRALLDFVAKATNQSIPMQLQFHTDLRLLTFTVGASLLATVLFGLVPALKATKVSLIPALKEPIGTGFSTRLRLNRVFLVSQVAICLPLLVAAGLFIRSFQRLTRVDLGFDPRHVVQIKSLAFGSSYTPVQFNNAWKQILDEIDATPGILSASASLPGLFSHSTYQTVIFVGDDQVIVNSLEVTPGYFRTLQIPLLHGRDFSSADSASMPLVGIVNQALAMRLPLKWNPIGELLRTGFGPKPIEIIGVVQNAKYDNVLAETVPTIYVPLAQFDLTPSFRVFEVRTSADSTATISTLQRTMQSIDPNLPAEIRPLVDSIGETLLTERLTARVTGLFGVVGLQLACIGLYGLMSYIVTQKTAEFGIRIAMGADRMDVFRVVMKEASTLLLVGVAIGWMLSVAGTHLIGRELLGTAATDPTSFVAATILMLFAGALASYMPARRATRIDPMVALRNE